MARSRNIKPGFFDNDLLAEIPALGRLLFIGLWTIADREGRLEDRPKKIKAQVLPYDECDVENLLQHLANRGFILRYEVEGTGFIQVVNWSKHQQPHVKEVPSSIPAPIEHGASTVQVQCKPETSTEQESLIPDSLNLIPDSLNLIPSNPNPQEGACEKRGRRKGRSLGERLTPFSTWTREIMQTLVDQWHEEDGPPADRRKISVSVPQWGERLEQIHAADPSLTEAVMVKAALAYLHEDHLRYKAPQFFFGPEGPWRGYVQTELTRLDLSGVVNG